MHDYQQISNIVIDVQGGDQNAFASLFELFQSEFYFFALKSVHEKGAAEDVTQNTFIEIFNSIGKLDDPNTFVKWAYTILRRQCSKHFRKEKDILLSEDGEGLFDTVESDHEEFLPGSILETQETRDAVVQLIGELPEEQRSAILLHYYEQMSIADIAEVVGCPANTVKTRLGYARNKIKARIKEFEKKGVKMLGVAPLPILTRILLDAAKQSQLAPESVLSIWEGVSQTTGVSAPLPSYASGAPSGSSGTAATTGTPASTASTASVTAKAIKTIVAVLLLGGAGIAAFLLLRPGEEPAAAVIETSPSPSPTAEPLPIKTLAIKIPDSTPVPTITPTPSPSPSPSPTASPTPSPKPTPKPTHTPSPKPTATPMPTPGVSTVVIGLSSNVSVQSSTLMSIYLTGGDGTAAIVDVFSSNPNVLIVENLYGAKYATGISAGIATITAIANDGGFGTLTTAVVDHSVQATPTPYHNPQQHMPAISIQVALVDPLHKQYQATASGGTAPYTYSTTATGTIGVNTATGYIDAFTWSGSLDITVIDATGASQSIVVNIP